MCSDLRGIRREVGGRRQPWRAAGEQRVQPRAVAGRPWRAGVQACAPGARRWVRRRACREAARRLPEPGSVV